MAWQLDPTGRFPQACFDWVKAQNPQSETEAALLAGDWLVDNGFTYDSTPTAWRITGQFGTTDCSGFVVICTSVARAVMGSAPMSIPDTSSAMARVCHALGKGLTAAQALAKPGSLGFHGPNEGMDGWGNAGHIKQKYFDARAGDPHAGPGVSIEAMGSFFHGVYWSTFLDGRCTYFADNPFLDQAVAPKVEPQMNESLNARLYDPATGGWFEGYSDGRVDYLPPGAPGKPAPTPVHGGMVSPADRADWHSAATGQDRVLSELLGAWFVTRDGVHHFGYTIVATTGETYVPEAQTKLRES